MTKHMSMLEDSGFLAVKVAEELRSLYYQAVKILVNSRILSISKRNFTTHSTYHLPALRMTTKGLIFGKTTEVLRDELKFTKFLVGSAKDLQRSSTMF